MITNSNNSDGPHEETTAFIFDKDDVSRLNDEYRDSDTVTLLRAVLRDQITGRVAVVSSFGAESAVLLYLIASIEPTTPVIFLETGKHFSETLQYRDLLVRKFNLGDVRNLTPDPTDITKRDNSGLRWEYDPDGCCKIRKVLPLAKGLSEFDSWISGRKSFQSDTRQDLMLFETDKADSTKHRLKINPLAHWSSKMLTDYSKNNALPTHPLVAEGFLSIGCSPCTRKVVPGEDPRSGRWSGQDKTECNIHGRPCNYDPVI